MQCRSGIKTSSSAGGRPCLQAIEPGKGPCVTDIGIDRDERARPAHPPVGDLRVAEDNPYEVRYRGDDNSPLEEDRRIP